MGFRCDMESTDEIPPAIQQPKNKKVSLAAKHTKVVFDLETSSRGTLSKRQINQYS